MKKLSFFLLIIFVCSLSANEDKVEATRKYVKDLSDKGTSHMRKSWDKNNDIKEGVLKERNDAKKQSGRDYYKDLLNIDSYKKEEE